MSKPFFASKLNWLGILTVLAALATKYVALFPPSWLPYITAVAGIATVILRTFGTSTSIDGLVGGK